MITRTALPIVMMAGLTLFTGCSEDNSTAIHPKVESVAPMGVAPYVMRGDTYSAIALSDSHATPDDVFAELQTALAETDYQRVARTLTPKAQTAVAGALLFELGLAMANDGQQADQIEQLLGEYVAEESGSQTANETADAAGTLRAMGSRVRHSAGFIAAALKVLTDSPVKQLIPQGELQDVEIDNTSAKGVVTQMPSEKSSVETVAAETPVAEGDAMQSKSAASWEPVEFQMIEGGWRIHLPDQVFEETND